MTLRLSLLYLSHPAAAVFPDAINYNFDPKANLPNIHNIENCGGLIVFKYPLFSLIIMLDNIYRYWKIKRWFKMYLFTVKSILNYNSDTIVYTGSMNVHLTFFIYSINIRLIANCRWRLTCLININYSFLSLLVINYNTSKKLIWLLWKTW